MNWRISQEVLVVALNAKIDHATLLNMLDCAARHTSDLGNRRYHEWVFQIKGLNVVSMKPMSAQSIAGTFEVWEDCDECEGLGCSMCDYKGEKKFLRRSH